MTEEQMEKLLHKLDAQADTLKEFAGAIKAQTQEMSELKTDVLSMKEESISFREELKILRKQVSDMSISGITTFGNKVYDDQHSTQPAIEEIGNRLPAAQSTPPPTTKPPNGRSHGQVEQMQKQAMPMPVNATSERDVLEPNVAVEPIKEKCQGHKIVLPPTEYDGKIPWSRYEVHFNAVARANGWTEESKAICLAAYLRGAALTFYETLNLETRDSF